jgi:CRISPR-associated protein Cas6
MSTETKPAPSVDVAFPLLGENILFEHGYALYGALSHLLPDLHDAKWLGIHPIFGTRNGFDLLQLTPNSQLRLRAPLDKAQELLQLQGKPLQVAQHSLTLGRPSIQMLRPSARLSCYRATIKHAMDDAGFLRALLERFQEQQIEGDIEIRRVRALHISDKKIICFRVWVSGLSPEHSIRLQSNGLGGRRHMGCGLFDPYPFVYKQPPSQRGDQR